MAGRPGELKEGKSSRIIKTATHSLIGWPSYSKRLKLNAMFTPLNAKQYLTGAWALIPNYFHILLRTGPTPISNVMRRLMTGYAVTFNKRHKRIGHLFQNRYKSVVCEEEPYLLELIRYIHLNPIRAGSVKDLRELDKYPWACHNDILGKRKNPLIPDSMSYQKSLIGSPDESCKSLDEKTTDDVLIYFGDCLNIARRRYRHFVKQGLEQGTRSELQGGGLIRSAGGDKRGLLGRKKEEHELADERILGSGNFVERVLSDLDQFDKNKIDRKISLSELLERISVFLGIEKKELLSGNRKQRISHARDLVSFLAVKDMGYKFSVVAKSLNVHPVTAARCAERGKGLVLCRLPRLPCGIPDWSGLFLWGSSGRWYWGENFSIYKHTMSV